MHYNKGLLKKWCEMDDWGTYLERNGILEEYISKEVFIRTEKEYFDEVKRRIGYCKTLLKEHEDALIHYTLAELYDRCNVDESPNHLYKRHVRYYALKTLEFDSNHASARELLSRANDWIKSIGGERNYMPEIRISLTEKKE